MQPLPPKREGYLQVQKLYGFTEAYAAKTKEVHRSREDLFPFLLFF